MHERMRSRQPSVIGWGMKLCSHWRSLRRGDGVGPDDMDLYKKEAALIQRKEAADYIAL
ncbi:hypothetical protein [Burkholderia vietnamiensis]|uniref:hypothetical protein n=1 Tax=Burkholderia vietnamiensis TaxID=60552 RepID=UPI001CC766B3|nr:hypothetical protein [Burkholderia vietnamiensis]